MAVSSDYSGLLFEAEVDDDGFCAEIRDWILQLTNEKDDEKDNNNNNVGQLLRETKHVKNPIVSSGGDSGSLYGSGYGYQVARFLTSPRVAASIKHRRSFSALVDLKHEYYEYFGPDYTLHVAPSNMENKNSRHLLDDIRSKLLDYLSKLQHAPSVQFQERLPCTDLGESKWKRHTGKKSSGQKR